MQKIFGAFLVGCLMTAVPALAHCGHCKDSHAKGESVAKAADKGTCGAKKADTCGSEAKVAKVGDTKTCDASKKSCDSKVAKVSDSKTCDTAKDCSEAKMAACKASEDCATACPKTVASGAPQMIFVIDGKEVDSACTAMKMTKDCDAKVAYKVGDKEYCEKPAAMKAYAKMLDKHLESMTKVTYVIGDKETCCASSAKSMAKADGKDIKFRVASSTFDSKEKAKEAAKRTAKAVESVKMTYLVGDKAYNCPMTAKASCASKCGGEKAAMKYVVNEMKSECSLTARVALLRAKINAASEAATVAQRELDAPTSAQAG